MDTNTESPLYSDHYMVRLSGRCIGCPDVSMPGHPMSDLKLDSNRNGSYCLQSLDF